MSPVARGAGAAVPALGVEPLLSACQARAVSEPGGTELSATLRRIERAAGALATSSVARMDESLPWFRELPADQRSWVTLVAQAGVRSLVQWLRQGGGATDSTQEVSDEVFATAPQALARSISLQQTVALIKVTIEVVEEQVSHLAVEGEEQPLREAVLRFSREIAFAAARVYARAAETRGSWDARLQALLVDALLRGDSPDVLASRAAALGWSDAPPVAVVVGRSPGGEVAAVLHTVYRQARRIGVEVIGGVHGDRLVIVLGGATDPLAATEKLLDAFGDGPVVVGPAVPSLDEATDSTRSALAGFRAAPAWPTAPRPVAAADLLPERSLAGDAEARRRLRHDVYAALVRAGGELLETLDAFFAAGGTLESAARALFVHPNTVRYRLKRVAEVTGFSPLAPRDAFALQVALTVGRLDPVVPAVAPVPNQTPNASSRKTAQTGDDSRRSL
ncbi:PucR family transcriptional regulator [Micromonospora auratinigra]|uniref:PucR C-terminal helix-turn-helix domain-containing protein n=1 Tax=Micromonospora auratinigra TaxID=261654 RepID=A0A1A8ZNV7_9ACTN|nr:helix-turn-helix domain-containing protein [Micromonospora auratinigra]SBT45502.1 PucR C-terminal helix-turn-helix domain-containing protein [Micromonospora auratinigra]